MLEDRPDRVSEGFGVVPDENVPAVLGGQPFEPTDVLTTASSRRTREPATAAHGSCGSSAPNPADRAASSIRRVGEAVRSPRRLGVRDVRFVVERGNGRGLDVPAATHREGKQRHYNPPSVAYAVFLVDLNQERHIDLYDARLKYHH